jgi:taurine dioxygenase
MQIEPLGGALGAEIRGIDLRDPSQGEVDDIYSTLVEHEVVFFRDAQLDDSGHMNLAERFGKTSIFPLSLVGGETKPSLQVIIDGPESAPTTDYWHTDVTWTAEPPKAGFLRAVVVPDRGGDTMWGSMTAAYDALSPAMQKFFCGLRIKHDNQSFIEGLIHKLGDAAGRPLGDRLKEAYPPVEHPLVRTHPDSGRRAIYFGGHFMRSVVGLTREESEAVLAFLRRHVDQPKFHCRWRWQPGDLAIWDERATVHRGLADHFPRAREVRRCVIDGDRPV